MLDRGRQSATGILLGAPGNGPSEAYKFASVRLLTMRSTFLSGCMLSGKLSSTFMPIVIIPLLKRKSKDPADVNNYRSIVIATAMSSRSP